MCARLLPCPLCSQPGFLTLDELRTGLISVATRPLICPVCNEALLGIDKFTIHLFSHTINLSSNTIESKPVHVTTNNAELVTRRDFPLTAVQGCNTLKTLSLEISNHENESILQASLPRNDAVERTTVETQNNLRNLKPEACYYYDNDTRCFKAIQTNVSAISPNAELLENGWANNLEHETYNESFANRLKPEVLIKIQPCLHKKASVSEKCPKVDIEAALSNKGSDFSSFKSLSPVEPLLPKVTEDHQSCDKHIYDIEKPNAGDKDVEKYSNHVKLLPHLKTDKSVLAKETIEHCDICGIHFPDQNILFLHKELVHADHKKNSCAISKDLMKSYSCQLCSKIFQMRGSLMIHTRVAHAGQNLDAQPQAVPAQTDTVCTLNNNEYGCPTCGKRFRKEQHVTQHLKTHEGKQWECDVCSKMFTTKYFLKKHKRLHSGEMPYKCNICDKTFTFQQSYHKHRLYHKDDKPHTCATCGRSFKELSTLHNHERIHTGEKPFTCETCGKCFRQRVSYLVHRRIHTGIMPYKCSVCEKNFRYKVSQRTHKCPAQQSTDNEKSFLPMTDANAEPFNVQEENSINQHTWIQDKRINTEENKFVLIVNTNGQHVLTKQVNDISAETMERIDETHNTEYEKINTLNKESTDACNNASLIPTNTELEKSLDASLNLQSTLKKTAPDVNDFLSIVMQPLANQWSSSPPNIEQLKVSVSCDEPNLLAPYNNVFRHVSTNMQMNTIHVNAEDSLTIEKNSECSLETINEESLKQLLYGSNKN